MLGAALQYARPRRAGLPGAATASALTAVNLLMLGTLLALPVLAVPAILLGPPVPKDLLQGLWVGLGAIAIFFPVGAVPFVADRPLRRVGATIQAWPSATQSCESALQSTGFRTASSASAT